MATTKLYLDLRGRAKDGKGSVVILLYHNFCSTSVPTGIRVYPRNWNGQFIIKCPEAQALNIQLQHIKTELDKKLALLSFNDNFESLTVTQIKHLLVNRPEYTNHSVLLADLFKEYVSNGNFKETTKDIYRITLKKVTEFGGQSVSVDQIDLKWLRAFEKYLSKTQSINGRAIYLRDLRSVCKYAKDIGIAFKYPFKTFQIKTEPTAKRCIPVQKLRELYSCGLDSRTEMYRDYFFLIFFLVGINTKDLLLAKKSQLVDGRLVYTREKTGKLYSIKVEPEAQRIIDKYAGKSDYLLDALDHCRHYKSFARQINEGLQSIGKETTEYKERKNKANREEINSSDSAVSGITTYFARHSWATIAYDIGISSDTIAQALGHSTGNRTTFIYIKPDQSKVDSANRKVIDYLLTRCE